MLGWKVADVEKATLVWCMANSRHCRQAGPLAVACIARAGNIVLRPTVAME